MVAIPPQFSLILISLLKSSQNVDFLPTFFSIFLVTKTDFVIVDKENVYIRISKCNTLFIGFICATPHPSHRVN